MGRYFLGYLQIDASVIKVLFFISYFTVNYLFDDIKSFVPSPGISFSNSAMDTPKWCEKSGQG